jgi:hypothetical protein
MIPNLRFEHKILRNQIVNVSIFFEDLKFSQGEGLNDLEAENHAIYKTLLLIRILRIEDKLKESKISKQELIEKFANLEHFNLDFDFFSTISQKEDSFDKNLKLVVFKSDDPNLFYDEKKEQNHRKHALESIESSKLPNNSENEKKRKRDEEQSSRKIIKI